MAENVTIARPYAEAIFALADTADALDTWSRTLAVMGSVASNPELRAATANPNFSPDQVYGLFAGACGDLAAEAQNLT
ncbi:MAG: F0F1 ATP synthase subunit delta, partial [Burkholderiales bacterium]